MHNAHGPCEDHDYDLWSWQEVNDRNGLMIPFLHGIWIFLRAVLALESGVHQPGMPGPSQVRLCPFASCGHDIAPPGITNAFMIQNAIRSHDEHESTLLLGPAHGLAIARHRRSYGNFPK